MLYIIRRVILRLQLWCQRPPSRLLQTCFVAHQANRRFSLVGPRTPLFTASKCTTDMLVRILDTNGAWWGRDGKTAARRGTLLHEVLEESADLSVCQIPSPPPLLEWRGQPWRLWEPARGLLLVEVEQGTVLGDLGESHDLANREGPTVASLRQGPRIKV